MLSACAGNDAGVEPATGSAGFANPERVTIRGYSDHVMEPALSPDGRYLFFNNSNEASVDTNLHWAERTDDLTFAYRGEIAGGNTRSLDGVPSMDRNNTLYFVSTRSYEQTASTIYRGTFANGALSGVELVPGVSAEVPGRVNFDAEISRDGGTLYFVDSIFSGGVPKTADIAAAERRGAGFERIGPDEVLQQVNTNALEYAPAVSQSGLELYFTRAQGSSAAIFRSTRASVGAPFGSPSRVEAAEGFVEGPCLSPDEKSLYYHKKVDGLFVLYRVKRP